MLLLLLACLHHLPEPVGGYQAQRHAPPASLAEVFAKQDPQAVYDEAVARRMDGDFQGAIERLAWLSLRDPSPRVLYQLGIAHELGGEPHEALAVYDQLLLSEPGPDWERDASFRRGLCFEDLGDWEAAYAQYQAIPARGLDGEELWTLQISRAITELHTNRTRAGRRHLERTLGASEDTSITWIRAKGWYHLMLDSLAEPTPLAQPTERKQVKALRARAGQLVDAERELVQIVHLKEPEFILAGLLSLGDGYASLAIDLAALPAPEGLSDDVLALYQRGVTDKVNTLRRKAWECYDQGLVVAGTFGLEGEQVEVLMVRREGLGL